MLSNKLFGLGMQTTRARDLVSVAAPIVERFAEEVHQAAHLVVAHRGETVVIAADVRRRRYELRAEARLSPAAWPMRIPAWC